MPVTPLLNYAELHAGAKNAMSHWSVLTDGPKPLPQHFQDAYHERLLGDALEVVGLKRGGIYSPEEVRQALDAAVRKNNKVTLGHHVVSKEVGFMSGYGVTPNLDKFRRILIKQYGL